MTPRDESTHSPTVTPTASSQQHSPESDRALLLVRVLKKSAERAPPFRNRFFFVDFSVRAQLLHRGLHVHCQGFFNSASKEEQLNVASSISQKTRRVVDDPVHHPFITKFLTVLPSSAAELLGTRQMVFPHNSPDICLEKLAQQFASPDVQLGQGISDVCFAVTPTLQTFEILSSIIVSSAAPCTISSHRSRTNSLILCVRGSFRLRGTRRACNSWTSARMPEN